MDNRKKNKSKNGQNPNRNTNTEVLNTEKEKTDAASGKNTEENVKDNKAEQKDIAKNTEEKKSDTQQKNQKQDNEKNSTQSKARTAAADSKVKQEPVKQEKRDAGREEPKKEDAPKVNAQKGGSQKESSQAGKAQKESPQAEKSQKDNSQTKKTQQGNPQPQVKSARREARPELVKQKDATDFSSEHFKKIAMSAAKILLPVAACAIVVAVIISYIGSRKSQTVDNTLQADDSSNAGVVALSDEPLAENAFTDVNELMRTFCTAMADGDMDTVRALKDYNTDKEIITYQEKSEYIERYDNINCYTKPGIEEDSYFVYVTYDVKFRDIETEAPGLNAFYVYTAEDGSLKIDGDTEENIKAAFKLVTSQDDVVDLYNEINVSYKEATASDEMLEQFMEELPKTIKASVGVALAQLETQEESSGSDSTQTESEADVEQPAAAAVPDENEELPQNKVVNQIVRTTDTVNVRSSDSEEADKIGKAQAGTELRRTEDRINGWSKVIFEDREAYIKSDYLEVVTAEVVAESLGTITAKTNVNVRSQANQESERLGSAQTGSSYNLLEDQGEWFKIDYNGTTGYVKAEFFER